MPIPIVVHIFTTQDSVDASAAGKYYSDWRWYCGKLASLDGANSYSDDVEQIRHSPHKLNQVNCEGCLNVYRTHGVIRPHFGPPSEMPDQAPRTAGVRTRGRSASRMR